ncbi:MAG: hypothetical protein KDE27_27135 [Planctomycetes bacterium]|nr:hypothetical protein [Planctomycetota bacterium]
MLRRPSALLAPLLALAAASCHNDSTGQSPVMITFNPTIYLGDWTGTWTNLNTSGTGALTVTVEQEEMTLNIEFDMDGQVFESMDPDPESYEAAIGASEARMASFKSDVFGALSATIDGLGILTISGTGVPGTTDRFDITGTIAGTKMTFVATITSQNGSITTGYATLDKM